VSRDDRLRLAFLGLHPERAAALAERHGGAGGALRAVDRGRVEVSDAARSRLVDAAVCRKQLERLDVLVAFREDDAYPDHLAALPGAPDVLFVRGAIPLEPGVAVIGTRRCTAYGRRIATSFGAALGACGWPVVSGLARGIDGAAHRGTVDAGGVAVAVLGSGSDVMYPAEHRSLHDTIVRGGGAVITEYPPGTPPEGWRFPLRNRIISGLSEVVVVVESAVTGGSLHTAAAALDQGRTVLAVPGDVTRASSVGCNLLIRDGAVPILGAEDLVEAVSLVLGPPPRTPAKAPSEPGPVVDPADLEVEITESGESAAVVLARQMRREVDASDH
jgi:DNA processing protein